MKLTDILFLGIAYLLYREVRKREQRVEDCEETAYIVIPGVSLFGGTDKAQCIH